MATATSTVKVNAAFLQEIKEDNVHLKELLARVRSLQDGNHLSQVVEHPRQLVELLGELRDQLATHFALEEAYGYFEGSVDVAPRLDEQAKALRAQHAPLFVQMCHLVEEAEERLAPPAQSNLQERIRIVRGLLARFQDFDQALTEHENQENDLILEAFNADIGVGD